ncbi:MAG: single-stranded-DNA-specific exonuclease RecJ [Firmicutes bacterium]|nr:single-stranded-DNA-specific exonuclease RecJ [Bacillota bacterium]
MRRWEINAPPEKDQVQSLSIGLDISPLVAAVLVQRGYSTEASARRFLWPQLSHLQTPFALDGMVTAVDRLQLARKRGERVGVFGDYDVDGITSTALLVLALRKYGLDVIYRLPERLTEGYGLSQAGLLDLAQNGASVIITVDCGIANLKELQWAKEQGLDIIVCDHHLPPPVLPPAVAIINPKVYHPHEYLFSDLAGVGVAMKLAWGLHQDLDQRWLELAALGTVADVVPLVDENRVIVTEGLKAMGNSSFAGLRALCEVAGLDPKNLKAGSISFNLAPRLNAPGRLGSAITAVELFLTEDDTKAYELAQQLEQQNSERQQIEADVLDEAIAQVEQEANLSKNAAVVVAGEGWHPGVIGIVASRLVDRWQRPTLAISLSPNEGKGSGRSIPGFSLFDGLKACENYLSAFGGHQLAAGFTLDRKHLPAFRQAFIDVVNKVLRPEDCIVSRQVDIETSFSELNITAVRELELLAPFGCANPEPVLMVRNVQIERIRQVGKEGTHLRLELNHKGQTLPAIGFRLGDMAGQLSTGLADVVCLPMITEWQGLQSVELRLKDIRTNNSPVELICQPTDAIAPKLADRRGCLDESNDFNGSFIDQCDLIFNQLPQQVSALQESLSKVPPKGWILLQFGRKEIAASREDILRRQLDRNFLAQVYLEVKKSGTKGVSIGSLLQKLSSTNQGTETKVQLALTVLEELGLINRYIYRGQSYVCLAVGAGKKRVDLSVSSTFNRLEEEQKKALELVDFFATAPPAILAEALARLWRECVPIAENCQIC